VCIQVHPQVDLQPYFETHLNTAYDLAERASPVASLAALIMNWPGAVQGDLDALDDPAMARQERSEALEVAAVRDYADRKANVSGYIQYRSDRGFCYWQQWLPAEKSDLALSSRMGSAQLSQGREEVNHLPAGHDIGPCPQLGAFKTICACKVTSIGRADHELQRAGHSELLVGLVHLVQDGPFRPLVREQVAPLNQQLAVPILQDGALSLANLEDFPPQIVVNDVNGPGQSIH
jgi:hypothetical protein